MKIKNTLYVLDRDKYMAFSISPGYHPETHVSGVDIGLEMIGGWYGNCPVFIFFII
jgi:hypothetical protein